MKLDQVLPRAGITLLAVGTQERARARSHCLSPLPTELSARPARLISPATLR
jgi:hypothetical protein